MNRKVIQIATTQDSTNDSVISVTALCDDGSIWQTSHIYSWREWKKLPDIPQRKAAKGGNPA